MCHSRTVGETPRFFIRPPISTHRSPFASPSSFRSAAPSRMRARGADRVESRIPFAAHSIFQPFSQANRHVRHDRSTACRRPHGGPHGLRLQAGFQPPLHGRGRLVHSFRDAHDPAAVHGPPDARARARGQCGHSCGSAASDAPHGRLPLVREGARRHGLRRGEPQLRLSRGHGRRQGQGFGLSARARGHDPLSRRDLQRGPSDRDFGEDSPRLGLRGRVRPSRRRLQPLSDEAPHGAPAPQERPLQACASRRSTASIRASG